MLSDVLKLTLALGDDDLQLPPSCRRSFTLSYRHLPLPAFGQAYPVVAEAIRFARSRTAVRSLCTFPGTIRPRRRSQRRETARFADVRWPGVTVPCLILKTLLRKQDSFHAVTDLVVCVRYADSYADAPAKKMIYKSPWAS
jgi:hypothetical protein